MKTGFYILFILRKIPSDNIYIPKKNIVVYQYNEKLTLLRRLTYIIIHDI